MCPSRRFGLFGTPTVCPNQGLNSWCSHCKQKSSWTAIFHSWFEFTTMTKEVWQSLYKCGKSVYLCDLFNSSISFKSEKLMVIAFCTRLPNSIGARNMFYIGYSINMLMLPPVPIRDNLPINIIYSCKTLTEGGVSMGMPFILINHYCFILWFPV